MLHSTKCRLPSDSVTVLVTTTAPRHAQPMTLDPRFHLELWPWWKRSTPKANVCMTCSPIRLTRSNGHSVTVQPVPVLLNGWKRTNILRLPRFSEHRHPILLWVFLR